MLGVRNNLSIHDKARGEEDENAATEQQQHKLLPRGAGGGGGRGMLLPSIRLSTHASERLIGASTCSPPARKAVARCMSKDPQQRQSGGRPPLTLRV